MQYSVDLYWLTSWNIFQTHFFCTLSNAFELRLLGPLPPLPPRVVS